MSRSVWSAWSLLPLSCASGDRKRRQAGTHSKRFAPFGCGSAARGSLLALPLSFAGQFDNLNASRDGADAQAQPEAIPIAQNDFAGVSGSVRIENNAFTTVRRLR